jgi:hypothetical protein
MSTNRLIVNQGMSAFRLDTNTYEHTIAVNPSILFFTIISSIGDHNMWE